MSEYRVEILFEGGESSELTLEALATACNLHPDVVERYVEIGLVEPRRVEAERVFGYGEVLRVRSIQRLRRELGVNLNGVAVILDLTDRIRALQREIEDLRASM
jgi:MerR family transcriptional regulator, heat shock protein HspR